MVGTSLGPNYDLARRISKLEKLVAGLATRDVLQNSSISSGGLLVNGGGSITIEGGGKAYVDGLQLSAVTASSVSLFASNFAVGTNSSSVVAGTVRIPDGYSQALIVATGSIEFANGNAVGTECAGSIKATLTGTSTVAESAQLNVFVPASDTSTLTLALGGVMTGITGTGNTLTFNGFTAAGLALPVNAFNAFSITGLVVFLA